MASGNIKATFSTQPHNNIKILLDSTKAQYDSMARQYNEGSKYYQNESSVTKTGAAGIDEVNNYLKTLGKNPLKSANNKIPTNWHKILTDQKIGYLFTYPPQIDIGDDDTNTLIKETLGDDYEQVIKQLGVDSSNGGISWLTYWYNTGEPFEYYFVSPLQVIPIYDSTSIKPKIKQLIRFYKSTNVAGKEITKYELWDDKKVDYYEGDENTFTFIETKKHTYGEIPFIPFKNNATATSDLKMYKELIDAIDKLISGFANDIDDIQEIIWVIKNYAGADSAIDYDKDGNEVERTIDLRQELKAKKLIKVDENGGVDALKGEIPCEARCKFYDILIKQLYISAMAVDPNPEKTGNATGTYIKFLYSLLELKAGLMETEYRPQLNRFIRAILKYLGKDGKAKIQQTWTRNKPSNDVEVVQMIAQTPSTVLSDETKTKEHPLTDDFNAERERIEKEQTELAKNMLDDVGGDE